MPELRVRLPQRTASVERLVQHRVDVPDRLRCETRSSPVAVAPPRFEKVGVEGVEPAAA